MKTVFTFWLAATASIAMAWQAASAQDATPAAFFTPSYAGEAAEDSGSSKVIPVAFEQFEAHPVSAVVSDFAGFSKGQCGGGCKGCDSCFRMGYGPPGIGVFADALMIRSRDSEISYAVPTNSAVAPPVQVGALGVVDMDYEPTFRFGIEYIIHECSKITVAYTRLESDTSHQVATQAPLVMQPLVLHPATVNNQFLQANALYDINFDLIDIDFHQLLATSEDSQLGYVVGVRLGEHEQRFLANFAGNTTATMNTDIDFYGGGLRGGLEWERFIGSNWHYYAKGYVSLMVGEYRADFDEVQAAPALVIDTGWRGGRIGTMWDLEVGGGWNSPCGNYALDLGYTISAWTNVVRTDQWIAAVQNNSFLDMEDTMTFDGFLARFSARF